ncbi:MAG: leucyl/phenylalanyl-tRNA--protein transferase [Pirellulales bacterium]|nr:leucyl/phenylalanyl-tRNA--protein transferase [Pirellulales bacterium]
MAFSRESRFFPPAESAHDSGLLALGGRLNVDWLVDAYSHGIFPWPFTDGTLAWFSPDPRAIVPLDRVRISRRLARTCRSNRFTVAIDRSFAEVIRHCATVGDRVDATWISPQMERAYRAMHEAGFTHSVEVRRDGQLVGGLYGVALGGMFAAESMFHLERDASNVALVYLFNRLQQCGYRLLDIQQLTPHLERFGAIAIPRAEFLVRLDEALVVEASFASPDC